MYVNYSFEPTDCVRLHYTLREKDGSIDLLTLLTDVSLRIVRQVGLGRYVLLLSHGLQTKGRIVLHGSAGI